MNKGVMITRLLENSFPSVHAMLFSELCARGPCGQRAGIRIARRQTGDWPRSPGLPAIGLCLPPTSRGSCARKDAVGRWGMKRQRGYWRRPAGETPHFLPGQPGFHTACAGPHQGKSQQELSCQEQGLHVGVWFPTENEGEAGPGCACPGSLSVIGSSVRRTG